ncbi:hypothetical protein [Labrenzia sp. OB1]|uniref:hypothetical protein n=1 Tax=Labrenzia sp. OB1 TaxID=1561204 RepID=UPI0007B24BAD|nr:hypothetical protein [Labrenzia sp. OB1]KZM47399.1 hypothetical protein OA90_26190 [Labrenzia sp. OB1]
MEFQTSPLDFQIFAQLARTATCVMNPLRFIHDDHVELASLDSKAVRQLASCSTFERPLNRALSKKLLLRNSFLSPGLSERLKTDEDLKTALHLLHCEGPVFHRLAKTCTAVQLYPQIKSCVLKSCRKQMETILGPDAFLTSLRETRSFYPSLPKRSEEVRLKPYLDGKDAQIKMQKQRDDAADEPGPDIHPLVWEGLTTLILFAERVDKGWGKLLALRLPKPPNNINLTQQSLSDAQATELKSLLKHRGFAC